MSQMPNPVMKERAARRKVRKRRRWVDVACALARLEVDWLMRYRVRGQNVVSRMTKSAV